MITIDEVRALEFAVDKVDVSGSEVSLSAGSLAALENVVVSGEVALDAASLAALENVTVSGTVELGSTTLAALETIELGATTLAALETVTVVEGSFNNWKSTAHSATSTASQLASTALSNRISVTIQNLGSADIFIGASNAVTIATGTKIAKGSQFSEKLGALAEIWVITASGTADLRISEYAA